jgi:hypothetical protein
MNSSGKTWVKVWGMLLVVFVLGGVTGAAIDGLYRSRAAEVFIAPSMRNTEAYFEILKRELNLTPDQEAAISAILDETSNDYKKVCAEVRPRYDVVRERARERMRALLVAEQQKRFDSIITQENCNCPDQKK